MNGERRIPVIRFEDIHKTYVMGENEVRAIDGIDLEVYENEMVAIVGQSGSGKSTCMNIIGCLDKPTKGKYYLKGTDVSEMGEDEQAEIRSESLGFIFQQYNLIPKLSSLENVELPLIYRGLQKEEREKIATEMLEKVGLKGKEKNLPSQLSGGQQQRVSIARALAGNPKIILADEPTGALDSKTSREVLDFLKELNAEGKTIVIITHDLSIAHEAKRVVRVADGRVVEDYAVEHQMAEQKLEIENEEAS